VAEALIALGSDQLSAFYPFNGSISRLPTDVELGTGPRKLSERWPHWNANRESQLGVSGCVIQCKNGGSSWRFPLPFPHAL